MSSQSLKDDLKQKRFKPVYLLHGEERYLVRFYTQAIGHAVLGDTNSMGQDIFDGNIPATDIINAADTLPFFADARFICVRDSKLFAAGRKNDTELIADYIPRIPPHTVMVFVETDVDKRSRLYKRVSEHGRTVDHPTPSTPELLRWLSNIFKQKNKNIAPTIAQQLLRTASHNMDTLYAESEKLIQYTGDRDEIIAADIEAVCSPSLEVRVFDLISAMAAGRTAQAITLYRNMLAMREQPLRILSMIIRQFRIMLQCKCAQAQKLNRGQITQKLALRDFIVEEALSQARRFTEEQLLEALIDCQQTDIAAKNGRLAQEIGVELLIIKYARE